MRASLALAALTVATAACVAFFAQPAPGEPMAAKARQPTPPADDLLPASCRIPQRFAAAFRAASSQAGVPLALLSAVAWEESRMNADAISAAGARGLLQVMPSTAKLVVVGHGPRANVLAGARYLRAMIDRFDDLELALSAYNAGPTAVERAGGAPTIETLRYAKNIELRAARLSGCT